MTVKTLNEDELRERLAAIEHERWSDWQRYVHDVVAVRNPSDGSLTIQASAVKAWERQMATPYADLTEREKDSDRQQVDRYWPLIAPLLAEARAEYQPAFDEGAALWLHTCAALGWSHTDGPPAKCHANWCANDLDPGWRRLYVRDEAADVPH